jgi:N-methylhydantoinase A/oxoprolinase/acetone carboxylase beta subunit
LLAADVRVTLARSYVAPLTAETFAEASRMAVDLAGEARAQLHAQDVPDDAIRASVEFDLRYVGQSFDLTVPLLGDERAIADAFHVRHEQRYGYAARDERVEIAAVRVAAVGAGGTLPSAALPPGDADAALIGERRVWDRGAFAVANVYERERLGRAAAIAGPAIVEQYDTTTWVPGGWTASVDAHANLVLERTDAA